MNTTITQSEALNVFKTAPAAGDIDLVSEIRSMLISNGLGALIAANYDSHRHIIDATNKPSEVQRFFLNRFWNLQLMKAPEVSIEERYNLLPNGDTINWLDAFKSKVMPFIIKHRLPVAI